MNTLIEHYSVETHFIRSVEFQHRMHLRLLKCRLLFHSLIGPLAIKTRSNTEVLFIFSSVVEKGF